MLKHGALLVFLVIPIASHGADCIRPTADVTNGVVLRAQPRTSSANLGMLGPGAKLPLVASVPNWYETQTNAGQMAFVSKRWTELTDCAQQPAQPTAGGQAFTIDVFDVGTGLSTLVRGDDFAVLYDAASNDDFATGANNRAVAYLRAETPQLTRLNHVILSHPHRDHVELLPDVISTFHPGDVWDSGSHGNMICGYWNFLLAIAADPSIHYHTATPGIGDEHVSLKAAECPEAPNRSVTMNHSGRIDTNASLLLGAGASMQFLYADGTSYTDDPNRNSLVVRFTLGSHHALFMGDAPGGPRSAPTDSPAATSIEAKLLACCTQDLSADILIAGHHGSETSSRSAFINAVNASIYVISSGPKKYGSVTLPDSVIVTELEAHGQVFRTDQNDTQCKSSAAKIGRDNDGQPGGCDAIRIAIPSAGSISATYVHGSD